MEKLSHLWFIIPFQLRLFSAIYPKFVKLVIDKGSSPSVAFNQPFHSLKSHYQLWHQCAISCFSLSAGIPATMRWRICLSAQVVSKSWRLRDRRSISSQSPPAGWRPCSVRPVSMKGESEALFNYVHKKSSYKLFKWWK